MTQEQKTIFISYSHKNFEIASEIETYLNAYELIVHRDINVVKYGDSFKEFMSKIRKTDFVIMIISDSFLKSKNCMYEVLEFIKDTNYEERILPIILNSNLYNDIEIIKYIKYWNIKYDEIENEIKELDSEQKIALSKNQKIVREIKSNIGDFISFIKDLNNKSFSELKKGGFMELFNLIELSNFDTSTTEKTLPELKKAKSKLIGMIVHAKNLNDITRKKVLEIRKNKIDSEIENHLKKIYSKSVFISYSKKNGRGYSEVVIKVLKENGFKILDGFKQELSQENVILRRIINNISIASIFVAIVTKDQNIGDGQWAPSAWSTQEIGMAAGLGKPILIIAEEGIGRNFFPTSSGKIIIVKNLHGFVDKNLEYFSYIILEKYNDLLN